MAHHQNHIRLCKGIKKGPLGQHSVNGNKAKMEAMGVIDLRKMHDTYLRLGHIFERVTGIIESYLPDELAIEAPFFGKNVQSMLKLGRAQGVAIAAAKQADLALSLLLEKTMSNEVK